MTGSSEAGHRKDPGPTISRRVAAPADAVWSVLADGWSYANWVVGAARVRDVDSGWPAKGTRVHHSFGLWPLLIQDFTRVESVTPQRELVLTARGWPVGEAHVHISVRPDGADHPVTVTADTANTAALASPSPQQHHPRVCILIVANSFPGQRPAPSPCSPPRNRP